MPSYEEALGTGYYLMTSRRKARGCLDKEIQGEGHNSNNATVLEDTPPYNTKQTLWILEKAQSKDHKLIPNEPPII